MNNDFSNSNAVAGPSTGDLEFNIVNGRKGRVLVRAQYRYYLHHTSGDGLQMWKCIKKSCPAKLKISGKKILREDSHICTSLSTIREEFKEECIRRAQTEVTGIPKIYQDVYKCFVDNGYNFVENEIQFKSVKSLMYRAKNSKLKVSKTSFTKPEEVEIPNTFEGFLLFRHNDLGIFAFATPEGRRILEEGQVCFMDGTFKSCPLPFYQLYSIHVDMESNERQTLTCPVVFVLLPNKEQNTYKIMLKLLKEHLPGWHPSKVIVDFEIAVINALGMIFPSVTVKGCNFHFQQALKKKAREFGHKTELDNRHVAKCGALAHLPEQLVEDGWLEIMAEAPNSESILNFNNYFVSTWLENTNFPIELWNCEGQRHRTTNLVESWHRRLNNVITKKPRLISFLQIIKDEAVYFAQYRCKSILNRSRKSINRDVKLASTLKELKEEKISLSEAIDRFSKF